MPESIDLTGFRVRREELTAAETRVAAARTELARARTRRDRAAAVGTEGQELRRLDAAVDAARLAERGARDSVRDHLVDIRGLQDRLAEALRDPAELVESLDGGHPVALLPVRLETRFFDGGDTLRIRIFPDQLHLDHHQPSITEEERAGGTEYWQAVLDAGEDTATRRAAWERLTSVVDAPRARYLVDLLEPTVAADGTRAFPQLAVVAESWTRPGRATALPDRFVAIGRRGGRTVFRTWTTTVPDWLPTTPAPGADEDDEVVVDPAEQVALEEELRWLTDFDEAQRRGMALTVRSRQAGVGDLSGGLDQLLVLGVDWTLGPRDAADRLEQLLTAHRYTDGLSFVPPGTATNQTSGSKAGEGVPNGRDRDGLDPDVEIRGDAPGTAGRRLAAALGIDVGAVAAVPGADDTHADTASLVHEVVWAAALGYYLEELLEPLVSDARIAELRGFVRQHLHPAGPLGTLRIGKQPYGLLPVVASDRYVPPPTAGVRGLHELLERAREPFLSRTAELPRMGTSADPGDDLLPLLQRTPLAQRARFRHITGPALWLSLVHGDREGLFPTEVANVAWTEWLSLPMKRIDNLVADEESHRLFAPWVQAGGDPSRPLEPDYLAQIGEVLRTREGRELLIARQNGDSLFESLVAFAATEELDAAIARLAAPARVEASPRDGTPVVDVVASDGIRTTLATTELVGVLPRDEGDDELLVVETHEQLANVVIERVTGSATLADAVAGRLREALLDPDVALIDPVVTSLAAYTTAVERLARRPAGEIEHAFRGYLDATSHRYDAWWTALASERLATVRRSDAEGIHLGAWGLVEDLRPDTGVGRDSYGYVHAPSLDHAASSAVLRAGHLSHRDGEADRFDLQLSSERVRSALPVLEGIAEGQSLAVLLGYHLERAIHEDELTLAQFILPLRRLVPLRRSGEAPVDGAQESISARDVVDGVALLERFEDEGPALFDALEPTPAGPARATLVRHVRDLAAIADAVGDVMVAEVVHQTVTGNVERAGAALGALDRQLSPPDPEFVRTPRTGTLYAQRLLTMMTSTLPVESWAGAATDARSSAAPRVNAWLTRLLPPAASIGFAGELEAADGSRQLLEVAVLDLGLSPVSLLAVAAAAGSEASELEQRIAVALVEGITVEDGAALTILEKAPAEEGGTATVGLGALRSMLDWLRALLRRGRPATAMDLATPEQATTAGVDVAELAARAQAAADALAAAGAALRAAVEAVAPDAGTLATALLGAAAAGRTGAVPLPGVNDAAARTTALLEQATLALAATDRATTKLTEMADEAASASPPLDEPALVEHHTERIRVVFGESFPVVPRFRLAGDERRAGLVASLGDQTALTGGDPLAPRAFIDRMALARPPTKELADVLLVAETFGTVASRPSLVTVAQLPHAPGQRWSALPFLDGVEPADPDLSLVVHADGRVDWTGELAGIVVDDYHESIPGHHETTGVSFHYDAPAARAPQTVLLATPPTAGQDHWSLEGLVAVVDEAMELADLRGLTPLELPFTGPFLPMTYLPHRYTKDRKPPPLWGLLEKFKGAVLAQGIVGRMYAGDIDRGD